MNITDLIVEQLEQGHKVVLPGIGTLDGVVQNAHHDPATGTFYPASRTIALSDETTDDSEIVKVIAERECISEDVAKQMWLNYIDALTDKMGRTGKHVLGRLGTLTCNNKKDFAFTMAEGLVLDAGVAGETPIEEVKIYKHDNEEDPFAQFEDETPAAAAAPEPAPAPEPVQEPAPEPASEPTVKDAWREELEKLDEMPKTEAELKEEAQAQAKAEKERLKAEKKAEEERIRLEKIAEEEKRKAEELKAKERAAAEKKAEEERRKAEEEMRRAEKKAEEERRKAEKEAEAARIKAEKNADKERIKADKKAAALAAIAARETAKAEAAARAENEKQAAAAALMAEKQQREAEKEAERQRIAAEKEAERQRIAAEKEAERQRIAAEKEAERQRLAAEKEAAIAKKEAARAEKERLKAEKEAAKQARKNKELADELLSPVPAGTDKDDEGKKKNRLLPILLILLLLCIIGGGAYLLLNKGGLPVKTGEVASVSGKHIDVPDTNALTYNTDMLSYSNREVMMNRDQVCNFMRDYVNQFLSDRNYSSARVPMMDRVRQYAGERLATLMGDRFAVQRLIPYEDYIYLYNVPCLKNSYASRSRVTVQKELMDYRALDNILYPMADELGLQPDGTGHKTAAEVKEVKQTEQRAIDKKKAAQTGESPVYVYVEKGSKQGYDIIAGFYLNKATAAKMTARLHELGCDAYIIEFNDLYYVSMGSASSQTSADALLKHIKSWYDGDAVIKKW